MNTRDRYRGLLDLLRSYGRVAVAFSGGVDSTLLLQAAHEALGTDVIAIIARARVVPARELNEAIAFCEERGIPYLIVEPPEPADLFMRNPPDRCYHCKLGLMGAIIEKARKLEFPTIADGTNLDDDAADRPGMRAIDELGIVSPLRIAGLTKQDIRAISHDLGLPTWNKQSYACLATRFSFGDAIDDARLAMVDEAEGFLLDVGFTQVRVRVHDTDACIELAPEEIARALEPDMQGLIEDTLLGIGFASVEIDPRGYRSK